MRTMFHLVATLSLGALLASCSGEAPKSEGSAPQAASATPTSCYAMVKMDAFAQQPKRKIFVLVDQTTVFDDYLVRKIAKSLEDYLGAEGGAFEIAKFSAFSANNYASSVSDGVIEAYNVTPAQEPDEPVRSLEQLKACLKEQRPFMLKKAQDAIDGSASRREGDFTNSEVMASLSRFSRLVKESTAPQKVVIVASDMLEHSQGTSFYQTKAIRLIEPQQELETARKLGLIGDFGGASIYVIGGGLLPPSSGPQAGRNPEGLKRLGEFWTAWADASNAKVIEFGTPDLMSSLAR